MNTSKHLVHIHIIPHKKKRKKKSQDTLIRQKNDMEPKGKGIILD